VELLAGLLDVTLPTAAALIEHGGSLWRLGSLEIPQLTEVAGLGPAKARRLLRALELGRRALHEPRVTRQPVTNARQAWRYLQPAFVGARVEELHAMYLDRRLRPIEIRRLSRGSDRFTVVDPLQVLRPAVALGATGVVLAHNHPSGSLEPSRQDVEVTGRVGAAARVVGIQLIDHLIVGHGDYRSMAACDAVAGLAGEAWSV
jgi:DNA repair protein RadC